SASNWMASWANGCSPDPMFHAVVTLVGMSPKSSPDWLVAGSSK
ncbi:MAG: hypothetical protein ACI9OD_001822, partial [Limisphaerales bacterium]